jgi:hypothetical protein
VLRPYVYSLGVLTTLFSFLLIAVFLVATSIAARRSRGRAEDDEGESINMSAAPAPASGD